MRRFEAALSVGVAVLGLLRAALAAEGPLIDPMEDASRLRVPDAKVKVESVAGREGKAVRLSFEEGCKGKFVMTRNRGSADWDRAAGFSFWVKGDGSDHLGCIELIWNENYAMRYAVAFPLDWTEWRKVVVPWRDVLPELARPDTKPIAAGGNAPSKITGFWLGKWYYWRDDAAHSYTLDELRLEPEIALDANEHRPAGKPLARVLAKLEAGKPITVVTVGDSLTDFRHWANREVNWPTLLARKIEKRFGSKVKLVNPAVGGTALTQNLITMGQWTKSTPQPDLVTVCFGFNDWDNGMRGPLFLATCKDAVGRVRRATGGKADVLLLTTCPAVARWDTMAELAESCRRAANETGAGLCDIYAAFHAAGAENRERLYCRDKTHLGPAGHELVARKVLEAIERGGK